MAKGGFLDFPIVEEADLSKDLPKLFNIYKKEEEKFGRPLTRVTIFVGKGNLFNKVVVCTKSEKIFNRIKSNLEAENEVFESNSSIFEGKFFGCIAQRV